MKTLLMKAFLMAMVAVMPAFALQAHADESTNVTNNFGAALDKSTETIKQHLDTAPTDVNMKAGWVSWAIGKTVDVVYPVFLVIGVMVAMFGLYTVLSNPAKVKEGMMTIMYGVV